MVCVTALPSKIVITTLVMFTAILVHSKCKVVIFDLIYARKRNNTTAQCQQMFEMSSYSVATGPNKLILTLHE